MHNLQLWWQNLPSNFTPCVFSSKYYCLRWYSLMYLAAFGSAYFLARYRLKKNEYGPISSYSAKNKIAFLDEFFLFLIAGLLLGARLGYFVFYDPSGLLLHPWNIFLPFENGKYIGLFGMSFHGGLIGAVFGGWLFCRLKKQSPLELSDFIIPPAAFGYFFGRMGNFLNGELFGKTTHSAWGIVFPSDPTGQIRHPSQLYEAFFEGLVVFAVLWSLRNKSWTKGKLLGIYLILYAVARFLIEFIRTTDPSQYFLGLTTAQYLCLAMVVTGFFLVFPDQKKSAKKASQK